MKRALVAVPLGLQRGRLAQQPREPLGGVRDEVGVCDLAACHPFAHTRRIRHYSAGGVDDYAASHIPIARRRSRQRLPDVFLRVGHRPLAFLAWSASAFSTRFAASSYP